MCACGSRSCDRSDKTAETRPSSESCTILINVPLLITSDSLRGGCVAVATSTCDTFPIAFNRRGCVVVATCDRLALGDVYEWFLAFTIVRFQTSAIFQHVENFQRIRRSPAFDDGDLLSSTFANFHYRSSTQGYTLANVGPKLWCDSTLRIRRSSHTSESQSRCSYLSLLSTYSHIAQDHYNLTRKKIVPS